MAGSKRVFNSAQLRFFLHENCIINAFACTEKTEGRERKRTGHNIDGDNVNYAGSGAPLRASEACVERKAAEQITVPCGSIFRGLFLL